MINWKTYTTGLTFELKDEEVLLLKCCHSTTAYTHPRNFPNQWELDNECSQWAIETATSLVIDIVDAVDRLDAIEEQLENARAETPTGLSKGQFHSVDPLSSGGHEVPPETQLTEEQEYDEALKLVLGQHKLWAEDDDGQAGHKLNLYRADLRWANLREVNLAGAYLNKANLGVASLREVNLSGACLEGANLGSADLSRTRLGGVNLEGALGLPKPAEPEPTQPSEPEESIQVQCLNARKLLIAQHQVWVGSNGEKGVRFEFTTNLSQANFEGCVLHNVDFTCCDMGSSDLRGVCLDNANLTDVKLHTAYIGKRREEAADGEHDND